jgi:predicted nuclease with RNAse H fold
MMTLAVGIDVGLLNGKGLDLVALDTSRRIRHAVPHLRDLDELTRIVERLAPDVVCIDSPSQWAERGTRRPAELDLARRGINLYATPSADRAGPFHRWMPDGFRVYAALAHAYPRYTGGDVRGKAAEYFPHASAVALNGRIGEFAEKIPIRRQLLAEQGVDEPMLIGADQVDAALGALTGLIALEGRHSWVGEGTDAMLLPVQELRARYLRAPAAPSVRGVGGAARPPLPAGEKRAPCLCGCGGTPVGRRSRFMPGHDQRVNSATGRIWNGLP